MRPKESPFKDAIRVMKLNRKYMGRLGRTGVKTDATDRSVRTAKTTSYVAFEWKADRGERRS